MRKLAPIWTALDTALVQGEREIVAHIGCEYSKGRRGGIEKAFAKAFEAKLSVDFRREVSGGDLEVRAHFPGRLRARVDCHLPSLDVALEYKAGRLPRNYENEFFDISQVAADIVRLRDTKIKHAYLILFVYGPLVSGTDTALQLYKAFHDCYFLDLERGKRLRYDDEGQQAALQVHRARAKLLEWTSPWVHRTLPENCVVKRTKQIGAICLDCQPGARIPKACLA